VHYKVVMMNWLCNMIVSSLLFFPDEVLVAQPQDLGLESENVTCVTNDGVKLFGWYLPAKNPKATLLLLHGNAGNISTRLDKAKGWVDRGVSVFLIDYRGYGKSEGVITCEMDLYLDGAAALKWLKDDKGIPYPEVIMYGESLGTAPAIEIATQTRLKGIILEVPFVSLLKMAQKHHPWVPLFIARNFQLDNLSKIGKILCPLFIIHGTDDDICPYEMGQRLFAAATQPKDFLTIPGGLHSDLREKGGAAYFDRPYRFLLGDRQ